MSKKGKYINYIVDDLVKNTEIDYDKKEIKYSFIPSPYSSLFFSFSSFPFRSSSPFSEYLQERYGVRAEEIKIVWKIYKKRILTLIKR